MIECEQYNGRLRDLCAGVGYDGRPNPTQGACDRFRERINKPPIVVTNPAKPSHAKLPKAPSVSRIGSVLAQIIADRIGAVPCGKCKAAIVTLNSMTPAEVQLARATIIEDIASRAQKSAPAWWQKALIATDQFLHSGGTELLIGLWIDEACREEYNAVNAK